MLMNLQRGVEQGIRAVYAGWSKFRQDARPYWMVLLSLVLEGCARPSVQEPVTLTTSGGVVKQDVLFSAKRASRSGSKFTRENGNPSQLSFRPRSPRGKG